MIARTLEPLASAARQGRLDVIVVCNACTDRTSDIARAFPGIAVIEIPLPSKTHALNIGDSHATAWPRIYLDADIIVSEQSLAATAEALARGPWLTARPASTYSTAGANAIVRAYYRARGRIGSLHRNMWGAGVYGLSDEGHRRLGRFPDVIGDDLWVDRLFTRDEKCVIDAAPVTVQVPRTTSALIAIARRNLSGAQETGPGVDEQHDPAGVLRELVGAVRSVQAAIDAAVYVAIAVSARLSNLGRHRRWERDDTSRA